MKCSKCVIGVIFFSLNTTSYLKKSFTKSNRSSMVRNECSCRFYSTQVWLSNVKISVILICDYAILLVYYF